MLSLNVPLPGAVRRRIEALRPALADFEVVREDPMLLVKRFGQPDPATAGRLESEARLALAGLSSFEVRLTGVGGFERPVSGPAPVAYLAAESPGLRRTHERLVETFGAVDGLEGDEYVPHVTVARGGDPDALDRFAAVDVEPVTWTVTELWFWDARYRERTGRVSLSG